MNLNFLAYTYVFCRCQVVDLLECAVNKSCGICDIGIFDHIGCREGPFAVANHLRMRHGQQCQ